MSNLFRCIAALVVALSAADYIISAFGSLIHLIPSLLITLPASSYIFISSLLFVIAYKLSSAMPNLFSNYDVGGLFISAFADDISSRIMSRLIDHFPSLSSKRRQIIIAKDLEIKHSDDGKYWRKWENQSDTRFKIALEAVQVWVLRIKAKINLDELSAETKYAAYLIFKTRSDSLGLHIWQEASISVGDLQLNKNVCIKPSVARPRNRCNFFPIFCSDGWMELELGQFYCDGGTGEVVVSLEEADVKNKKTGLIVAGIDIRPI